MNYRCPYCKQDLGPSLSAKCPACGKIMIVPEADLAERRRAKRRALERIAREHDKQIAELGPALSPALFRNPKVYLVAIVALALIGGALYQATSRSVGRARVTAEMRAVRNLDVLAEALGRYRFHTGQYPDRQWGLAALVRDPRVPKWDGPYINMLRNDPWNTPFVYEPRTNALPVLFSCGPDAKPGTPDDLHPDPARFEPGTAWTNGWVSAAKRWTGVKILPPEPAK